MSQQGVEFLVVGGVACALNGFIRATEDVDILIKNRNYEDALSRLVQMRHPIDIFFDRVMVMVDNRKLRDNRLVMLHSIVELFTRIADFSSIVVETTVKE